MTTVFFSKVGLLLLLGFGIMIGTHAAYAADSPAEAEADVERASVNATADIEPDNAVNKTTLRMTERTLAISEWWAPRYQPLTAHVPYWAAQFVIGLVATSPVTMTLYRVVNDIRGVSES